MNQRELEKIIVNHVEVVFAVAMQLTGNTADAERLARITFSRALRTPEKFENGAYAKSILLAMLRHNFIQTQKAKDFSDMLREAATISKTRKAPANSMAVAG